MSLITHTESGGTDFYCPACDERLDAGGWDTEYGDPIDGTHEVTCADCGWVFEVRVRVGVTYTAIDNGTTEAGE